MKAFKTAGRSISFPWDVRRLPVRGWYATIIRYGHAAADSSGRRLRPRIPRAIGDDQPGDEIIQLREEVLQSVPRSSTPLERAEAMRAFVFDYIEEKNLSTAFASASEVARTRIGDCSEHGVLLAAMLRADGIPARVAHGLVFVPGFGKKKQGAFGWHMWTQAMIDGAGRCRRHLAGPVQRGPYHDRHILPGRRSGKCGHGHMIPSQQFRDRYLRVDTE